MVKRILHSLLLCLVALSAAGQKMVYLQRADNLQFDQERIADAQILKGDVVFRHEEALMYCDSAYFYEKTNSLDAFGHVRFEQGDTLQGFCDKLYYDGNTKIARMRQNVRLIHGRIDENPTIVTTDSLNYNRAAGVAYYYSGGEIKDSLNTLVSIRGHYYPKSKQAVFSEAVHLTNPKFVLTSDTLWYNTDTKVTDFVSPTVIVYEEETTIYSSNGWYNTESEQSMLLDQSRVVHEDGRTLTGDTIYYDKRIGFGRVLGHMEMSDSVQQATLYGEYGEMWEEGSRGYATDSALMIDWSDAEHLAYIHADTLFTEELHYEDSAMQDSTYYRVKGYYGVRVFRDDVQMVCDSMVYLGSDSTIHLYMDPVSWSGKHQFSADSMIVFTIPTYSLIFVVFTFIAEISLVSSYITQQRELNRSAAVLKRQVREKTVFISEINRDLVLTNKRLLEGEVARKNVLSNVSHDLRTPITAIRGYAELMISAQDNLTLEQRNSYLSNIVRRSEQMERIVADIMELTRMESSDSDFHFTSVSIAEMLDELVVMYSMDLEDTEKHLSLDLPPRDSLIVKADPAKLSRVFENLISNAINYTEAQANIVIKAWRTGDVSHIASQKIHVTVEDNGIGIPEQDIPRIFDRFYRAHNSGVNIKGTGLGLAIVKLICDKHDAEINVTSKLGEGTTFEIILSATY